MGSTDRGASRAVPRRPSEDARRMFSSLLFVHFFSVAVTSSECFFPIRTSAVAATSRTLQSSLAAMDWISAMTAAGAAKPRRTSSSTSETLVAPAALDLLALGMALPGRKFGQCLDRHLACNARIEALRFHHPA